MIIDFAKDSALCNTYIVSIVAQSSKYLAMMFACMYVSIHLCIVLYGMYVLIYAIHSTIIHTIPVHKGILLLHARRFPSGLRYSLRLRVYLTAWPTRIHTYIISYLTMIKSNTVPQSEQFQNAPYLECRANLQYIYSTYIHTYINTYIRRHRNPCSSVSYKLRIPAARFVPSWVLKSGI